MQKSNKILTWDLDIPSLSTSHTQKRKGRKKNRHRLMTNPETLFHQPYMFEASQEIEIEDKLVSKLYTKRLADWICVLEQIYDIEDESDISGWTFRPHV